MNIIQDFIPVGRPNRPGLAMVPLYITIHDTDNDDYGADAKRHAQYIKTTDKTDSWHYTVDDTSIYQHLPLDENGWHAGDGPYGQGNRKSIGIEICMNPECDRTKAEANAAWLVAKLLREVPSLYDYPEAVKQHYDWSWKNCPSVIRGAGRWPAFMEAVRKELEPVPDWMTVAIKDLEKRGILTAGTWKGSEVVNMGLMAAIIVKVLKFLGK